MKQFWMLSFNLKKKTGLLLECYITTFKDYAKALHNYVFIFAN